MYVYVTFIGRNSAHGIAHFADWTLRGQNPDWTRKFLYSVFVQADSGSRHSFFTMSNGVGFPGVKRPELGVDHPTASGAEVKERINTYLGSTTVPPVTCFLLILLYF